MDTDTLSVLQSELLLSPRDVDLALDRDPSGLSAKCLVPVRWLNRLARSGNVVRPRTTDLSEQDRETIVQNGVVSDNRMLLVYVTCVPKNARLVSGLTFPVPSPTSDDDVGNPSVMSYLQRVCDAENNRYWKQFERFKLTEKQRETKSVTSGYVSDLVRHIYSCTLLTLSSSLNDHDGDDGDDADDQIPSLGLCHPNLLSIFCALEGKNAFFFVHPYETHTLKELVTFTPAVLDTLTVKQLFIIYQLLQALRELHSHNIAHGRLTINGVVVNKNLWIRVPLPRFFVTEQEEAEKLNKDTRTGVGGGGGGGTSTPSRTKNSDTDDEKKSLIADSRRWISGEMSNFDYLMALNAAAGRRIGNPNHHPVMPWIMDFSQPFDGWRDLTKSKFRLNKGDGQLDLTYDASTTYLGGGDVMNAHQVDVPPHHVTDVLSDLTYYVYMARRVPKATLCAHVRPNWVPNEYPVSIQRMQSWTPDECVPQFFTDPLVFYSIHPDLPDLEVPAWASSPEDFVAKHRAALESQPVSENLHHWIDVTFGYKLSGSAAIDDKNVYLSLVDDRALPTGRGVVQLFTKPHPRRRGFARCLTACLRTESRLAASSRGGGIHRPSQLSAVGDATPDGPSPMTSRQNSTVVAATSSPLLGDGIIVEYPAAKVAMAIRDDADAKRKVSPQPDDVSDLPPPSDPLGGGGKFPNLFGRQRSAQTAQAKQQVSPDLPPIELPRNFDPLALLRELELIGSFNQSCLKGLELVDADYSHLLFDSLVRRDVRYLACLIVDMLAPEKTTTASPSATLDERLLRSRRLIASREIVVPLFVRDFLDVVVVAVGPQRRRIRDVAMLMHHLRSDMLLSPFHALLPFPSYFPMLYECLRVFVSETDMHASAAAGWTHQSPVDVVASYNRLFRTLDADGFEVLLPFLLPLFGDDATRFSATVRFFGEISRRLGRRRTFGLFLKPLLTLMENPPDPKAHARLLYVGFIRQLITGFGMEGFLERFSRFIVGAIVNSSTANDGDALRSGSQSMRTSVDRDVPRKNVASTEETDGDDATTTTTTTTTPSASPSKIADSDDWVNISAADVSEASGEQSTTTTAEFRRGSGVLSPGRVDVSQVAMDTLRWLCSFIGPVLTSNYLVGPLLKGLGSVGLTSRDGGAFPRSCPALKSLMRISSIYGKTILLEQYVPYVEECVKACELRLNAKTELNLVSAVALLRRIIIQLPYITLLHQIETMCRVIFQRIIVVVSSPTHSFSGGRRVRLAATRLLVDTLVAVATRLGREEAQPVLAFPLQQFFSAFDRLYPTTAALEPDSIARLRMRSLMEKHEKLGIDTPPSSLTENDVVDGLQSKVDEAEKDEIDDFLMNGEAMEQLRTVFTPSFAQSAYFQLCQLMGQINMRRLLYNADLIEQLAYGSLEQQQHEKGSSASKDGVFVNVVPVAEMASIDATYNNPLRPGSSDEDSDEGLEMNEVHFGETSWFIDLDVGGGGGSGSGGDDVVGDRLSLAHDDHVLAQFAAARDEFNRKLTPSATSSLDVGTSTQSESERGLEGTWYTHWKNLRGSHPRSPYRLERLKLQSYTGHVGSVKSLCAVDSQQLFLSGGRDKTVKLWGLKSQGDGSAELSSPLTYSKHQRPLLAVDFIERTNTVLSTCTSLHIWDPDKGNQLRCIESFRSPIVAVTSMPSPHAVAIAATADNYLQFADIRVGQFVHNWKMFCTQNVAGTPRCVCVDNQGRYFIAGFTTGALNLFDVRTGLSVKFWKAHLEDVVKIRPTGEHGFVTAAQDDHMFIWNSSTGSLATVLRGHNEGVVDAQVYRDEIVTVSGSKLGIHTVYNAQSSFNVYRVKPDLVKNSLTSLELLPLSREFLVGTDSGQILHLA